MTPSHSLQVDPSVSFDQVGGLEHYIKALKEMVFLPLVYPELFERFHLSPPRGVLFYGPPGQSPNPHSLVHMLCPCFRCWCLFFLLALASYLQLLPELPQKGFAQRT